VLLLLVLGVAVYSPILSLRTIRVEGTQRLSSSTLRTALGDQLGIPLALLDSARIRQQLSAFPLIRSYVTEVVPPNTLVVHVVERQPVADIKNGTAWDQVDPAGVVIAAGEAAPSLPVIDVGGMPATSNAFAAAVAVVLSLPRSLSKNVATVSATSTDDVSLTLKGSNRRVVWGSADRSAAKAAALALLLTKSTCKSQPVIDVSAPKAVTCGPEH
jgi:cell division protein FtsQ